MSFQCPVCEQTFKRVQDCTAHIQLKKDTVHQQFALKQERDKTRQFSETLQAASSAAAIAFSMRPPVLAAPTVHTNDVDQDDLPSSRSMDLDGDGDSDYEAGIDSD